MKKVTSVLLLLAMLISIIYIPRITVSAATVDLPNGYMTIYDSAPSGTGWIEIDTAADFKNIQAGKKYYLSKDITVAIKGTGSLNTQFKPLDVNGSFTLDGRGHTIKTDNSLFEQLEAGTIVRNLVIASYTYTSNSTTVTEYVDTEQRGTAAAASGYYSNAGSGYSCGALAWRSAGATIINVVNNVKVDYRLGLDNHSSNPATDYNEHNEKYVRMSRVGGIIGSVLGSTPTVFENCWNKADVVGGQQREGLSIRVHGVGGIVGYVHDQYSTAVLVYCKNSGTVTSRYTKDAYAGGLVGSKHSEGTLLILNGDNTGTMNVNNAVNNADQNKGQRRKAAAFFAGDTSDPKYEGNITGVTRILTADDFAGISGDGKYYLSSNISSSGLTVTQNKNDFSGRLYGCYRTLKSTESPFENMLNFTHRELTMTLTGDWTRIETADQFKTLIDNTKASDRVNKYYLGANITLPDDWSDPENFQSYNSAEAITLEGCGYTITTSKPIFSELPGGGDVANGIHSLIRNLKIKGNVSVTATDLTNYGNGVSVGALAGKASGGIFEHIINNANVTLDGENLTARVGGIVGSAFNDAIYMMDCTNNGNVTASVTGNVYAVGGVLAYAGYDQVEYTFINCINNGKVQNNSTKVDSYAGGVLGTKNGNETTVYLIDCANSGKIYAKSAYGSYCSDRLFQNVHIIKTIPITTEEEFLNISGNKAYSLKNDLTVSASNTNSFSGLLVCYNYKVTSSNGKLFDNDENPWVLEIS